MPPPFAHSTSDPPHWTVEGAVMAHPLSSTTISTGNLCTEAWRKSALKSFVAAPPSPVVNIIISLHLCHCKEKATPPAKGASAPTSLNVGKMRWRLLLYCEGILRPAPIGPVVRE